MDNKRKKLSVQTGQLLCSMISKAELLLVNVLLNFVLVYN
jgi:hypothetical protein